MPSLKHHIIACGMVVAIAAPALSESIAIRANSALPEELIEFIARNAVPTVVPKQAKFQKEKVGLATCGYESKSYSEIFKQLNHQSVAKVRLPACIYALPAAPVIAQPNDTLTTVLEREIGVTPDQKLVCPAENKSNQCEKTFRQLVAELNPTLVLNQIEPKTAIILPFQTRWQTFKLPPDTDAASASAIRDQIQLLAEHTVLARLAGSTSLVKPLSIEDVSSDHCKFAAEQSTQSNRSWPYDIGEVVKVLTRNTKLLKERFGTPKPTVIALLDTGILYKGDFFPNKYFAANFNEQEKGIFKDRDHNGYKSDVFGINANTRLGDVFAYPQDPMREHGSHVANLALGGRPFRSAFKVLERYIKIKIVKLVAPYPNNQFSIPETSIVEGLKYSSLLDVSVANVSAGSERKIASALEYLKSPAELIAVVAAGNDYDKLGDRPVYPANYGGTKGDGHDNVITVIAHDAKGKPAEFSNVGSHFADIAAPGCDLVYQDDTPRLFGTSFAAPLVSFTVGLMRSFGFGEKSQTSLIKQRLQVASDYDPDLATDVAFSGRLNIPKTLSLYDDVLEIREHRRLIAGRWSSLSEDDVELCSDGQKRFFVPDKVRKITTLPVINKIRILYENDAVKLDHTICSPNGNGLLFSSDDDAHLLPADGVVPWSLIVDFVPGFYR